MNRTTETPKEGWVYPTSRFVAAEDEVGVMWTNPRQDGRDEIPYVRYVRGDIADEYERRAKAKTDENLALRQVGTKEILQHPLARSLVDMVSVEGSFGVATARRVAEELNRLHTLLAEADEAKRQRDALLSFIRDDLCDIAEALPHVPPPSAHPLEVMRLGHISACEETNP